MQVLANGLITGLAIGVFALAFQLVYLPTKIFYFAIAAVFAVAPFGAWQALQWGAPLALALAVSVAMASLVSVLMEWLTHRQMDVKRSSLIAHFIASLGYNIVIIQLLTVVWGNSPKVIPAVQGSVDLGGVFLSQSRLLLFGGCILTLITFFGWLRMTNVGLQFRGLADNTRELAIRGFNIRRLRLIAFAISGAMTGIVGVLLALENGFYSYSGLPPFLLAVVAAIIGGRNSFVGAVLGGILLGVMRAGIEWFLSPHWLSAFTFAALILFLLFRPQGIVATHRRIEAEG